MSEGNFEKKIKNLEEIVEKLESGELDIEETLELFQDGMKLGKDCRKMLDEIEEKVNKVLSAEGSKVETEQLDV
ncbi:exodeoxyribonuclease VII, small subunit [Denitrovibrio acetiphilus DSM 12809]|uniref:Exodeoxyribonuclease 7 small subunit n=1 Tax=Denitrovibrio acetiphilus (strain DSM 12809 / NBRC 114555 / N2460) TaxID=522772 RepID=D4H103_DENA2|nr:exodeoxyribonuclease VII small subunit [Denitrovibrio acetiphilus]ADD68666.1 exodeoxyribonuclease VII, small subunit [Denitrovibrio acetiphilus DSM 12809]